MLISQVHSIISLYRIRGAQYSYAGNVINFREDIDSYTTELLHDPLALMTSIIFQKETLHEAAEFIAQASKQRYPLTWPKAKNIYYQHIQISDSNLTAISENGDLSQLLPSLILNLTHHQNLLLRVFYLYLTLLII